MQPPATIDELLTLLESSHLLEAHVLPAIRQKLPSPPDPTLTPAKVLQVLVQKGVLTKFQAEQLLQGRHKGFFVKQYKILDQVGIGGMARVFLAEHSIMRRKVALKILPKSKCADPASLARFQREARAIAAINHPNVIRAYDISQEADFFFIVLEYAEGQTIEQFVEAHGAIPWPQACDYLYQAASGIEHLSACGIVHRDVKPSNIIIEKSGTIKLCDLGLAVFFENQEEADQLTRKYNQNALGSADYLAPEQVVDSHSVDSRADIYSLGATFCFMLSGEPPYPGGTIAEKLHHHQVAPPISIQERAPDVPKELDALLQKMLAKRADDRFQSITELKAVLRRFVPVNSVAAQLSGAFTGTNGAGGSGVGFASATSSGSSKGADASGLRKAVPPPSAGGSGLQKAAQSGFGLQRASGSGSLKPGSPATSHSRIAPPPPQKSGTFKPPKDDEEQIFEDNEEEIFEEDELGPDDEPEQVGIAPGESLASISSGKLPRLAEQAPPAKSATPKKAKPKKAQVEEDGDDDEDEIEDPPRVLGMPRNVAIGVLGGVVLLLVALVAWMNFL